MLDTAPTLQSLNFWPINFTDRRVDLIAETNWGEPRKWGKKGSEMTMGPMVSHRCREPKTGWPLPRKATQYHLWLLTLYSLPSPPQKQRQLITWHHRSRSSSSNQKYANTKVCFFSDFNHVRWKSITESSHVSLPSSLDREHSMSLIPARSPLSMQPHSSASHLELWLPPLQAATPPFCSICFSEPHLLPPL